MARPLLPLALIAGLSVCLLGAPPAWAGPAEKRALELNEKSASHYRAGRFREAAELLREAYDVHPDPELLYNLARALEGLRDLKGAREAYTRYLTDAKRIPDRKVIEARIASLDHQLQMEQEVAERRKGEPVVAPLPPAPLPPAPEKPQPEVPPLPSRSGPGALSWIVAGAGVAGLAVGVSLRIAAFDEDRAANAEPKQTRAVDKRHDAESLLTASNVTLIASGAVAAAGGGMLLVGFLQGGQKPARTAWVVARPAVAPGWLGVSGSFR